MELLTVYSIVFMKKKKKAKYIYRQLSFFRGKDKGGNMGKEGEKNFFIFLLKIFSPNNNSKTNITIKNVDSR